VALTRRGRILVTLIVLACVVAVPLLAGYLYLLSIGLYGPSDPGRRVDVTIPKGASANEIGEALEEAGVIKSAFGFRLATFVGEESEEIQAGNYRVPTGLNARDALTFLVENPPEGPPVFEVTFPEGSWLVDMAAVMERDTGMPSSMFLQAATSGRVRSRYLPDDVDTLEGLLFPSTYEISTKESPRDVVERLVRQFQEEAAEIDMAERARAANITPYEAVIVASMVEAETFQDEERGKVARVIYNRLNQGMMLGIDATVLYALGEHKESLSASDLEVDSPYNTRKVVGLPPTPIGAPGLASLEAALEPEDGDWLYYVLADCEGHHAFSATYDDFLADKAAYQNLDCG
jgi:UPF0755 protein